MAVITFSFVAAVEALYLLRFTVIYINCHEGFREFGLNFKLNFF